MLSPLRSIILANLLGNRGLLERVQWRLRNERRNSWIPDLGSASDWLNQISHATRPIRSITEIWVVTRHQYGISEFFCQTSFGGETSGSVAICLLFAQAIQKVRPDPGDCGNRACVSRFVLVIVIMIEGSEKRNCEGGFCTSEFACFWKAQKIP